MNHTHTNLTRITTPAKVNLVDRYANSTLPFAVGTPGSTSVSYYSLAINQTITIPNRLYFDEVKNKGNILQGLPVYSNDSNVPGELAIAVNDGSTATKWQPSTNLSALVLINTTTVTPTQVSAVYLDWGARPPTSAAIYLGNTTEITVSGSVLHGNPTVISLGQILPDLPYDAATTEESIQNVTPVIGNSTKVNVTGAWSGNYVALVIEGCWESDGIGATVGEFVLYSSNGSEILNVTGTVFASNMTTL